MKCFECDKCASRGNGRFFCLQDKEWVSNDNYYYRRTIACSINKKAREQSGNYLFIKLD
jgi:hypothetical protein